MAVILGCTVIFSYDCIRVFRRVLKHKQWLTAVEDFIFWVTWAMVVYRMLYRFDYGSIRSYSIVGMIFGICLYGFCISRYFVKYLSLVFNYIRQKIAKTLSKLLKKIAKAVRIRKTDAKKTNKTNRESD